MMAARDQLKNPTDSSVPPPKKRERKRPDEKALLDSTKHLNYDGPNQKGMTKPLKPIPVFNRVKVNIRGPFTTASIKPSK